MKCVSHTKLISHLSLGFFLAVFLVVFETLTCDTTFSAIFLLICFVKLFFFFLLFCPTFFFFYFTSISAMNDGRSPSMTSLGINTQTIFSGSSVSSNSPLNSPLLSPAGSPFPMDSSWDQLQNQFNQQMSLHPPPPPLSATVPITNKSGSNNTFVHKLYK